MLIGEELKPEEYFNASANHYAVLLVQEFNRDSEHKFRLASARFSGIRVFK